VHRGEPYYLGMFLVGAYQEILGDIHNLFGDTNSVHVIVQEDGSHYIEQPIKGDHVDDMLRAVGFDTEELYAIYELKAEASDLGFEAREDCLKMLRAGLEGYTYFED
jgi:arginine decarboxylase